MKRMGERVSVPHLAPHFQDRRQQSHAARLGMWVFIGSEALLFSALFALYAAYWAMYPTEFRDSIGYTDHALGAAMTGILLTSSLLVAISLDRVRADHPREAMLSLGGAILLGLAFLCLKAFEYKDHFEHGLLPGAWYRATDSTGNGPNIFFTLYYTMTGLHAIHVIAGLCLLGWLIARIRAGGIVADYDTPLELGGMYWHFVDVVWVFLWPLFYLLG